MSKLFYITNERDFKSKIYPLQPPGCCIQYTTLFSLRKASAHKKQTPALLKAHSGLMAILIWGRPLSAVGTNGLMSCAQSPDESDGLFCRQNCKNPKYLL